MNDTAWQARLAARLHDPPEKALVLLRAHEGHEGGTVRVLLQEAFPDGVPPEIGSAVERADHWAAAADRAAFPKAEGDRRYPAWQQIVFADEPVLIHPLSGEAHRLQPLSDDVEAAQAQTLGTDHLRRLLQRDEKGAIDARRSALALWRFGAELQGDLAEVWKLLPADGRVPDHTIHDHLDLTAAFAGAFASHPERGPALLAVSIGPVQDFIAAARSTSDLWAGSHLLSRLAWEAMRVVCEDCGPEAILFPRLRGVPQVDLWLVEQGLPLDLFAGCEWRSRATDANPLFAAALPNRFTALVPAAQARGLAQRITEAVREFAAAKAKQAFACLLREAGIEDRPDLYGYAQIARQLERFPEVHWAAVPWTLGCGAPDEGGRLLASDDRLAQAMRPFFAGDGKPGWLGSPAWQLLSGGFQLDAGWFYKPNPGALYPALHELLERALAAVKSARPFGPMREEGWRCALTGEGEWITTDRNQLATSYRTQTDTVWAKVAERRPSWVKAGEHLSALPMLKRLWPTLFVEEVNRFVQGDRLDRFVVSTHTMALASAIERAIEEGRRPDEDMTHGQRVALPRRLDDKLRGAQPELQGWRYVPGWLEAEIERDEEGAAERARKRLAKLLDARPETYYGLLLMDGDDMGAWLSAGAQKTLPVKQSFHPTIRQRLEAKFGGDPNFAKYAETPRAPNPAWHMAISDALNQFALHLVPEVVERRHLGRVIYAGGDDVLAMLAAKDLLPAAQQLRDAYRGADSASVSLPAGSWERLEKLKNGWAKFAKRVLRLMGERATASAGLVIAHHQAPLGAVMRELRAAEKRAKALAGKDAWSLAVLKRGGGALYVTAKWGEPLRLFGALRELLARDDVSRRAAFHVSEWVHDVPADQQDMVEAMLVYQMQRQCASDEAKALVRDIVPALVGEAFAAPNRLPQVAPLAWLADFMMAAEFLAREQRHARARDDTQESARRAA